MKGLLIKDFYYLFQRKQSLLIFIIVALILGFTNEGSFIYAYMTMLGCIMSLSTISYDTADNGMPFLMTLPVKREDYALSKYIFSWLFCAASWLFSIIVGVSFSMASGQGIGILDNLESALVFLLLGFLLIDVMVPVYLKYGPEKSKYVLAIVYGFLIVTVLIFEKKFAKYINPNDFLAAFRSVPSFVYLLAALVFSGILTFVSIKISAKVMKEKTF